MKLWSKTLIASAVCLFLAGCDDSSKVDANLDKAKDNAQQIKEAASDKADAIKDEADKHIDAIKNRRLTRPTISAARPPASRRRRIKKRKQLLSRPRPRLMPSSRMPGRKATKSCRKLAKLKTARLLMPIIWPTMRRIKQKKLKRVSLPLKPQKMRPMLTSRHHTDYFSPSSLMPTLSSARWFAEDNVDSAFYLWVTQTSLSTGKPNFRAMLTYSCFTESGMVGVRDRIHR